MVEAPCLLHATFDLAGAALAVAVRSTATTLL
jgi:hypothetical protein